MSRTHGDIYSASASTVRLPRYFRVLRELLFNDRMRISSAELASLLGIAPSQVRQDLGRFNIHGSRGYGYNVKLLYTEISKALGAGEGYTAILITGGVAAGTSVSDSVFAGRGVTLLACFGDNPSGGALPLSQAERFCADNRVNIAVIAVPDETCAAIAPLISRLKVDGVWNLTSHIFETGLPTVNLSVGDSLMELCYRIKNLRED